MINFLSLIGFAILIIWLAFKQAGKENKKGLGSRLPTIIGCLLTWGSFIGLPWVKFAPAQYVLKIGIPLIGDYLPEWLAAILHLLGQERLAGIVSIFESLIGVPAIVLALFIPTSDWFVRLALMSVGVLATLTLVYMLATIFIRSDDLRVWGGVFQCGAGLIAALILLSQMPAIDLLGTASNLPLRFVAVIAGARMSTAVWFAWVGLILIGIGGLIDAAFVHASSRVQDELL